MKPGQADRPNIQPAAPGLRKTRLFLRGQKNRMKAEKTTEEKDVFWYNAIVISWKSRSRAIGAFNGLGGIPQQAEKREFTPQGKFMLFAFCRLYAQKALLASYIRQRNSLTFYNSYLEQKTRIC